MPKYFDSLSQRPWGPSPVLVRAEPESVPRSVIDQKDAVAVIRKDGGATRTEQALRKSSHAFNKFQHASQTRPIEVALSETATDASITLRVAIDATRELLDRYRSLPKPDSEVRPEQTRQRAELSGQILSSVEFEFDCMDALADTLDGLQRFDAAKLVVARDIAGQAASQQAKLGPLLAQREQQSAAFQAARSKISRQSGNSLIAVPDNLSKPCTRREFSRLIESLRVAFSAPRGSSHRTHRSWPSTGHAAHFPSFLSSQGSVMVSSSARMNPVLLCFVGTIRKERPHTFNSESVPCGTDGY